MLQQIPRDGAEALAALAGVPRMRGELDDLERALIASARESGASWAAIAGALGLRSRQAAEQRSLRLDAALTTRRDAPEARQHRRSRHAADELAGSAVTALRRAVRDLLASGTGLPELTRSTLRIAATADPGALVDLARLAGADLGGHPASHTQAVQEFLTNLL